MTLTLIVDDSRVMRKYVRGVLSAAGNSVLEAFDGSDALELIRRKRPDLVISDLLMPTMDGYELVRQMRADPQIARIPVIFCTGHYLEPEARALSQRCGVTTILVKPCAPEQILHAVGEALRVPSAPAGPSIPLAFESDHLRLITDKLSERAEDVVAANLRLGTLVDLIQQISSERETPVILERTCESACRLLGARLAAIGMLENEDDTMSWTSVGGAEGSARLADPDLEPSAASIAGLSSSALTSASGPSFLAHPPRRAPVDASERREELASAATPGQRDNLEDLLASGRAVRSAGSGGALAYRGLPPGWPAVHALLAAPMRSPTRLYGWLVLANTAGAEAFSEQDERIAVALATQAAVTYESAHRVEGLEVHARELEQINRNLNDFAAVASHDLREPLRQIVAFIDLLRARAGTQLDEPSREWLNHVQGSAGRLGSLVSSLSRHALITRGTTGLERASLSEVVSDVLADLTVLIQDNGAHVDAGNLPTLVADRMQMYQLFENLISNAVKFHEAGREPFVSIRSEPLPGRLWRILVEDNGIGFDPRDRDRIFEPFQRLRGQNEFEGAGIGLATCRKIVARHGGRIDALSKPGIGSTFSVVLPEHPFEEGA